MPLPLRLMACALACTWASSAAFVSAQDAGRSDGESGETVVLLAPADVRAEWMAALQIELATRRAVAVAGDPPVAPTTLLGDAGAQQRAIAEGAQAAFWVHRRGEHWQLRMIAAGAERARVVPLADDVDPRTVALIVVSLLDAPDEPLEPGIGPEASPIPGAVSEHTPAGSEEPSAAPAEDAAGTPPSSSLATPDEDEAPPTEEPEATPAGERVRWAGRVGLGIHTMTHEELAPGGSLRAGIAMRYDWFELAVLHDLGFYFGDVTGEVQPFGRACVEAGMAGPRVDAAFHWGARGCFGSIFLTEHVGSLPGDERLIISGPRTHISGGGYVAVSFALESWLRLFVRLDVDVGWTDLAQDDSVDVMPMLSTFLSFS